MNDITLYGIFLLSVFGIFGSSVTKSWGWCTAFIVAFLMTGWTIYARIVGL